MRVAIMTLRSNEDVVMPPIRRCISIETRKQPRDGCDQPLRSLKSLDLKEFRGSVQFVGDAVELQREWRREWEQREDQSPGRTPSLI